MSWVTKGKSLRLADNALISSSFCYHTVGPCALSDHRNGAGAPAPHLTSQARYWPSLRGSPFHPRLTEWDVPSEAPLEWNVPAASLHVDSRSRLIEPIKTPNPFNISREPKLVVFKKSRTLPPSLLLPHKSQGVKFIVELLGFARPMIKGLGELHISYRSFFKIPNLHFYLRALQDLEVRPC